MHPYRYVCSCVYYLHVLFFLRLIYGFIGKDDAKAKLLDEEFGTFLLRFSESSYDRGALTNTWAHLSLALHERYKTSGTTLFVYVYTYIHIIHTCTYTCTLVHCMHVSYNVPCMMSYEPQAIVHYVHAHIVIFSRSRHCISHQGEAQFDQFGRRWFDQSPACLPHWRHARQTPGTEDVLSQY